MFQQGAADEEQSVFAPSTTASLYSPSTPTPSSTTTTTTTCSPSWPQDSVDPPKSQCMTSTATHKQKHQADRKRLKDMPARQVRGSRASAGVGAAGAGVASGRFQFGVCPPWWPNTEFKDRRESREATTEVTNGPTSCCDCCLTFGVSFCFPCGILGNMYHAAINAGSAPTGGEEQRRQGPEDVENAPGSSHCNALHVVGCGCPCLFPFMSVGFRNMVVQKYNIRETRLASFFIGFLCPPCSTMQIYGELLAIGQQQTHNPCGSNRHSDSNGHDNSGSSCELCGEEVQCCCAAWECWHCCYDGDCNPEECGSDASGCACDGCGGC